MTSYAFPRLFRSKVHAFVPQKERKKERRGTIRPSMQRCESLSISPSDKIAEGIQYKFFKYNNRTSGFRILSTVTIIYSTTTTTVKCETPPWHLCAHANVQLSRQIPTTYYTLHSEAHENIMQPSYLYVSIREKDSSPMRITEQYYSPTCEGVILEHACVDEWMNEWMREEKRLNDSFIIYEKPALLYREEWSSSTDV